MPLNHFPKFQTAGWWINELKEFPKDATVYLYTGARTKEKCMLSIYMDEFQESVLIDIGEPENDE